MNFDPTVCRRVVFNSAELATAFHKYLDEGKQQGVNDYGYSAMKRVYLLHIKPYPHRVEKYKQEYLVDYPEETPVSKAIAELVAEHGWRTFLEGLSIFVKNRTRMMPLLGYKLSNVKDIYGKIMSLRTVVK